VKARFKGKEKNLDMVKRTRCAAGDADDLIGGKDNSPTREETGTLG